jgi:two-component SAPR family response regulator
MGMREKHLLVLTEDSQLNRQLAMVLPARTRIRTSASSQDVLEWINQGAVKAVIIDCTVRGVNGLELLAKIRSLTSTLPVAFLAMKSSSDLVISAVHLGIADFLAKPVSSDALRSMVQRLSLDSRQNGRRFLSRIKSLIKMPTGNFSRITDLCIQWLDRLVISVDTKWKQLEIKSFLHSIVGQKGNKSTQPHVQKSLSLKADQKENAQPGLLIQVQLLGPFQVFVNGKRVNDWPGHKAKLLFAYLCYYHRLKVGKDVLMEKFWPSSAAESARNSLNVALHGVRQWLVQNGVSAEVLAYREDCYFFQDIHIALDTDEFTQKWKSAQRMEKERGLEEALSTYEHAARLYKGDFIEEYPYESWTDLERENLREIYILILDRISKHYALDGKPEYAADLCEQILIKDNCREDIYRRKMKCFERLGQRDRAIRTYKKCAQVLREELDVAPSEETSQLFERIKSISF